jgi:glycosyltransferase involved in cell wall biosynthesis
MPAKIRKVCFVYPFAIVGGIETLFATILKYIPKDRGVKFYVAAPMGIRGWTEKAIVKGVPVFSYTDNASLAAFLDAEKPDLCVAAFSYSLAHAIEMAQHKPMVLETSHNLYHSVGESIRAVAPWIVHIVAVSKSVHDNVTKSKPSSLQVDTSVILTGVDLEIYRVRNDVRKQCKHYAYFGRLSDPEKGVIKMFDAFRALGDKNLFLHLYGKGNTPDEDANYRVMVNHRYRDTNINFKGFVQNPEDYYHHNDVITIRSPLEGFCNTAIEAMACGVPLVAYNFHGVLDHVPPRVCLIADNQQAYLQQLFDIQSHKLRTELSKNALEFVKAELDAARMANQYMNLIQSLLGKVTVKAAQPVVASMVAETPAVVEEVPLAGARTPYKGTPRVAGVCSQYSVSIEHAMKELGATPVVCTYGQADKPLYDFNSMFEKLSKYDAVIFNAACPGYIPLVKALSDEGIKTYALYHSAFGGFSFDHLFDGSERQNLQLMLDWSKSGLIKKVGFVNRGSAEYFATLGYKTGWLPNVPSQVIENHSTPVEWKRRGDNNIHIGAFSRINAMKNTMTSVAAALSIPNSLVHTVDKVVWMPPGLLDACNRIVTHGWLSKDALADAMARMHVNTMLSFTESYGLLVTESWAVGAPCIIGPSCKPLLDEFEANYMLKEFLYVERTDDAADIVKKLNLCITHRNELSDACKQRVTLLRKFGMEFVEEFFND